MSKAMDALDLIRDFLASCPPPSGRPAIDLINAAALLRDYITTTEAERATSEPRGVVPCPECGGDGADHEDSSENCWNCNGDGVVRDTRNITPPRDASAARIKELEEALGPQWISVEDKVPTDGASVLCSGLDWGVGPSRHYEVASFNGRQFYEISHLDECPYITHWMPLPEAPKALPPNTPEPTP